jgi:hypothetical protein
VVGEHGLARTGRAVHGEQPHPAQARRSGQGGRDDQLDDTGPRSRIRRS